MNDEIGCHGSPLNVKERTLQIFPGVKSANGYPPTKRIASLQASRNSSRILPSAETGIAIPDCGEHRAQARHALFGPLGRALRVTQAQRPPAPDAPVQLANH